MANRSARPNEFKFNSVTIFLSELFGTAVLVFLTCASCLSWNHGQLNTLQGALSSGIAVLIAIQMFGCISGAHINPAVSIAATIYGVISVKVNIVFL